MKQKTKIFAFLSTLWAFGYALFAGEQDNWYLAKEWEMDNEIRGLDYYRESSTGLEKIYVATNNGIQVLDMNGTLLQTLVQNQYVNDVEVDENGTLFYITNDSLHSMSNSPGRVVSVTVDHNGSQYRQSASGSPFYNYNENGNSRHYPYLEFNSSTGSGARAYVRMEENSTDTDGFNRYAAEVVVLDGGAGYTAGTKAFIARSSYMDGVSYSSYNNMDNTDGVYDEANFTVVIGSSMGTDWTTDGFSSLNLNSLAIDPSSGDLYVTERNQKKIMVFDRNGTFVREFGSEGQAPGQFSEGVGGITFNNQGKLVITSQYNNDYWRSWINLFETDGTFVERYQSRYNTHFHNRMDFHPDGMIVSHTQLGDDLSNISNSYNPLVQNSNSQSGAVPVVFTKDGGLIMAYRESSANKYTIKLFERAYRTKGLPTPNALPLPAIRGISQRAGTNIIDLDFEILDPDDSNATVGILASSSNFSSSYNWILPTAWVDGTEAKIGNPIETNVVHRVSWNVKGDWLNQTGTLSFEVLAQDARRSKPVDLHFLELPLDGASLTISRSPVKDADMVNYFKHQLAMGTAGLSLSSGNIFDANGTSLVSGSQVTESGLSLFNSAIGYRWANPLELQLARFGSSPGSVNQWAANKQIKPRNLPSQVNEYGFDVGNHGDRAWWVVKASTLSFQEYDATVFDNNSTSSFNFGQKISADGGLFGISGGPQNDKSIHIYETDPTANNVSLKFSYKPAELAGTMNNFGLIFDLHQGTLAASTWVHPFNFQSGYENEVYLVDVNGSYPTLLSKVPKPASSKEGFGSSLALSESYLAVGEPWDSNDSDNWWQTSYGTVHLFQRETNGSLTLLSSISNPDGNESTLFGSNLAMEGDLLTVGQNTASATKNGNTLVSAGKVMIYRIMSGSPYLLTTLYSPNPKASGQFGGSLAMEGSYLAVGETGSNSDGGILSSGAVHLYKFNSDSIPELKSTIYPKLPEQNGNFGSSLALSSDRLLIGTSSEDVTNWNSVGAAYLYSLNSVGQTTLLSRLAHPKGRSYDNFGGSVGLADRIPIVGASGDDSESPNYYNSSGSATIFKANN